MSTDTPPASPGEAPSEAPIPQRMMARFCAYGFLKNQRYFEPFLVLIWLDQGLSFLAIGGLIALREATTNALELASGALADTWGRRRAMIASFVAYIASFVVLATAHSVAFLALAMVLYGAGDAFRSGTHKAMILTWLKANGRGDAKAAVYGVTRSWSKLGSAASVIVGAAWVMGTGRMEALFALTCAPYVLGLLNLATYPARLDGVSPEARPSLRASWAHLVEAVRAVAGSAQLRGLIAESSGFMGAFKASKDYVQPLLQAAASAGIVATLGAGGGWGPMERTALLIGPVYVGLFVMSAMVSRSAGAWVARFEGDEARLSRWLWAAFTLAFAALLGGALARQTWLMIGAMVALYGLEGLWRPVLVSRIDSHSEARFNATIISVESQGQSAATMVGALALGGAVDWAQAAGQPPWWPLGAAGLLVGVVLGGRAWWGAQNRR